MLSHWGLWWSPGRKRKRFQSFLSVIKRLLLPISHVSRGTVNRKERESAVTDSMGLQNELKKIIVGSRGGTCLCVCSWRRRWITHLWQDVRITVSHFSSTQRNRQPTAAAGADRRHTSHIRYTEIRPWSDTHHSCTTNYTGRMFNTASPSNCVRRCTSANVMLISIISLKTRCVVLPASKATRIIIRFDTEML